MLCRMQSGFNEGLDSVQSERACRRFSKRDTRFVAINASDHVTEVIRCTSGTKRNTKTRYSSAPGCPTCGA